MAIAKKYIDRLIALNGILSMHERAAAAGVPCKLNGESRRFDMSTWDCGTAACLGGSAGHNPWFRERGVRGTGDLGTGEFSKTFWGPTHTDVQRIFFGFSGIYGWSGLYGATIPMVREALHRAIKKHGGSKAVARANRLKLRGDKLRMGIA